MNKLYSDYKDLTSSIVSTKSESESEIKDKEIIKNKLPHDMSLGALILDIRKLFFDILELLVDKKNPIKYIFSTERRKFSFAVLLIMIGGLLLLLSNLMR